MLGTLKRYGFINAKLRARIGKIIPDELLKQMIRAPSLPESIQLLRDTSFAVVETMYNKTGDLKICELELFKKEVNLYLELECFVEGGLLKFIQALSARYEIDNLKNALRLWFDQNIRKRSIEEAVGYIYRGKVHYDLHIDGIINSETIEGVIHMIKGTPYSAIVSETAAKFMATSSTFPVEIALDHYFYKQLLSETERLNSRDYEIAQRMIGVEIDMQNINWIIRFKSSYNLPLEDVLQYIIPRGYMIDRETAASAYASQNVADLLSTLIKKRYSALQTMLTAQSKEGYARLVLIERILEQIMLYEVRHVLAGYPFTIGIMLAYFILKRNEIKKIMTILNAKYYRIAEERIKSVL